VRQVVLVTGNAAYFPAAFAPTLKCANENELFHFFILGKCKFGKFLFSLTHSKVSPAFGLFFMGMGTLQFALDWL